MKSNQDSRCDMKLTSSDNLHTVIKNKINKKTKFVRDILKSRNNK